jgi:hypothetical protein
MKNLLSLNGLLDNHKTKIGAALLAILGLVSAFGYHVPDGLNAVVVAYMTYGVRDAIARINIDSSDTKKAG